MVSFIEYPTKVNSAATTVTIDPGRNVLNLTFDGTTAAGTYTIGSKPVHGIVSSDNSTLWVANFGADLISIYSIDDGKLVATVHTGSAPDALAFSADEHLLLATDARSGDVSVIRTQGKQGPALFTILPAGGSPNAIAVKAIEDHP